MFKSIGLERSKLKIPIIDFASMTYLPDTKSKSWSNFVISFTKDFTLSIEFKEIGLYLPYFFVFYTYLKSKW